MADEPETLILPMLRGIRETLDAHTEVLAGHGKRLEHIERNMNDLRMQFTYALGLATAADYRSRTVENKTDDLDEKLKALEAALVEKP